MTTEVARVRWRTPPPTSIDEELVVADDGSATLVVRTPRDGGPTIGSYTTRAEQDDLAALAVVGDDPVEVDLLDPGGDDAGLVAAAQRVATQARRTPLATLTFRASATRGGSGVTLFATAEGTQPTDFELDPAGLVLHAFDAGGQPLGWHPLPAPQVGFVDRDARGLGGLRTRTTIAPGGYGAIVFDAVLPAKGVSIAIGVTGTLRAPTDQRSAPCSVTTAPAPIRD